MCTYNSTRKDVTRQTVMQARMNVRTKYDNQSCGGERNFFGVVEEGFTKKGKWGLAM